MELATRRCLAAMALGAVVLAVPGGARALSPTDSSGEGCLPGNWYLDNTAIFLAIREQMRAQNTGTDFTLETIHGDYIARIDPQARKVDVTWNDWVMEGFARTANGAFPVRMRLDGLQSYEITEFSATAMAVALRHEGLSATVSFSGMVVSNPMIEMPRFSGGAWDCAVDTLSVVSEGRDWRFDRADF
jgi:hypothetical protein